MVRLDEKDMKRFNDAVVSLAKLCGNLLPNGAFDEGHIEWLQTDIQSLTILAEKMETLFYV